MKRIVLTNKGECSRFLSGNLEGRRSLNQNYNKAIESISVQTVDYKALYNLNDEQVKTLQQSISQSMDQILKGMKENILEAKKTPINPSIASQVSDQIGQVRNRLSELDMTNQKELFQAIDTLKKATQDFSTKTKVAAENIIARPGIKKSQNQGRGS